MRAELGVSATGVRQPAPMTSLQCTDRDLLARRPVGPALEAAAVAELRRAGTAVGELRSYLRELALGRR